VAQTGDPTAHAEIRAINIASQRLRERGFATGENGGAGEDYKGYTFFILTDPCPMCMAAMHYAGPDEVPSREACDAQPDAERGTHRLTPPLFPHQVVYLTTRSEYSNFYRDDRRHFKMESFYQEIGKPHQEKNMPVTQFPPASGEALKVYKAWSDKNLTPATTATGGAPDPTPQPAGDATACPHAFQKPPAQDRPETTIDGEPVPAWKSGPEPGVCKRLLETSEQEFDKLIDVVATRGDPYKALRLACREVHLGTRANYKDMIYDIGRNIFPLIVALDNEPSYEGIGSTFTLYLKDGSSRRIVPCPPEYEVYKGLSHISLGLFTFVSPYFRTPKGNPGWHRGLAGYLDKISVALKAARDVRGQGRGGQLTLTPSLSTTASPCWRWPPATSRAALSRSASPWRTFGPLRASFCR
jgi:hypothetical protein